MNKKVARPQKMFQTPKNRQARNHPILLLGYLGTQKTGSGLSVFQNVDEGDPGDPTKKFTPDFQKYRFPGVPRGLQGPQGSQGPQQYQQHYQQHQGLP